MKKQFHERARDIPFSGDYDVIVCGGGPAGFAAAVTAARRGAKTQLIETNGCLGGIWTAGLMTYIIDYRNKDGVLRELMNTLDRRGARGERSTYDIEKMKFVLEEMCLDAGVDVRLHTRVAAAVTNLGRLETILTESKSGREAWGAEWFVDCTGDGDVAALAGCGYDLGREENGEVQPMSMVAMLTGLDAADMAPFTGLGEKPGLERKRRLLEAFRHAGVEPSYGRPTLFQLYDDLYLLMANHEYQVSALDADAVSAATIRGRREINQLTDALKASGGVWRNLKLVATSEHIGVRESRRIHGRYRISVNDIKEGKRHPDAVCRCAFGVDVHSTNPASSKELGDEGVSVKEYDIPLRALTAKDVDGLLMAGRCISGDFYAHASYRVTGDAVAMGEAAGACAASSITGNR